MPLNFLSAAYHMCWVIISVYLWILCCVRDVYADFNFGPQLFAEEVWSPVMWRMRLIYFTKDLVWHLLLHWAENFAPTSQIQLHCCTFAPLGTFHHMNWSWLVTVSRMMWVFFIPLWTLAFKGLLYNSTFSSLQLAWCNSQKPSLLPLSLNTIAS